MQTQFKLSGCLQDRIIVCSAREEKKLQAQQAREVRAEEKKALIDEKKAKNEDAKKQRQASKAKQQIEKQEQKDLKELFLKGVEEYGRKEYETAIATFQSVIESESANSKKLYSGSSQRMIDKTRLKMKQTQE